MIKKYFILSVIAALLATSCVEKVLDPVLQVGPAPTISEPADGTSFVLTEDQQDNIFSKFSWSAADFGFAAGVTYTLELDTEGNSFAGPLGLGVVNGLSINDITIGQINGLLLTKGLPDNVAANIEFRVVAKVNPDVDPVTSNPIKLSITPYKAVINYPKLQVPGAYQGWDPANETTVIHSLKSDGKYEGYMYFADPNTAFKYTDGPSWDTNWGDTGADGTLDLGGDDIVAADAGVYKLNADINALTHAFVKTDWGLIGSATPDAWDSDQNMTFDPLTGIWSITLDLIVGDIKFRANDGWDIEFGDDDGNKSLEYGGANIAITEAGSYTIELILNVPDYTYTVKKN